MSGVLLVLIARVARKERTGETVSDLIFIGGTLLFFALSVAYVYACGRLR